MSQSKACVLQEKMYFACRESILAFLAGHGQEVLLRGCEGRLHPRRSLQGACNCPVLRRRFSSGPG